MPHLGDGSPHDQGNQAPGQIPGQAPGQVPAQPGQIPAQPLQSAQPIQPDLQATAQAGGSADQDLINLTNALFGEVASEDKDTMVMVGSTMLNRLEANRPEEFGSTVPEVLQKGYFAVSNPNVPYRQAITRDFPDKVSENKYKQALAVMSGLHKGTIDRREGHFYFTDAEIKKIKRRKKKTFNFKAVEPRGEAGPYKVFGY